MADSTSHSETGDDRTGPDHGSGPGTSRRLKAGILSRISRWQKVVGLIAVLLVLLFVVWQLTGVGGGLGDHIPQPGPPPGGH